MHCEVMEQGSHKELTAKEVGGSWQVVFETDARNVYFCRLVWQGGLYQALAAAQGAAMQRQVCHLGPVFGRKRRVICSALTKQPLHFRSLTQTWTSRQGLCVLGALALLAVQKNGHFVCMGVIETRVNPSAAESSQAPKDAMLLNFKQGCDCVRLFQWKQPYFLNG